jgi:uncharacterized membrane protein
VTDRRLRTVIAGLALAGFAIATYLTWVHYAGVKPICTGISNCERVQTSSYAKLAGVPVAVIGVAGYAAILASLAVRGDAGRIAGAFLAFVGLGVSGYLTWAELFRIDAICQWCVASAIVMTLIAVLATVRALMSPEPARASWGPLASPAPAPRPARARVPRS